MVVCLLLRSGPVMIVAGIWVALQHQYYHQGGNQIVGCKVSPSFVKGFDSGVQAAI